MIAHHKTEYKNHFTTTQRITIKTTHHHYRKNALLLAQALDSKTALQYPPEPLNEDGWTDWIKPLPGYILQCCDCGSLHEMEFDTEDGAVVFRAKPIDSKTAGDAEDA